MAVFSISRGANGLEASVDGVSVGASVDANEFRSAPAKVGLSGLFHDNALGVTNNPVAGPTTEPVRAIKFAELKV